MMSPKVVFTPCLIGTLCLASRMLFPITYHGTVDLTLLAGKQFLEIKSPRWWCHLGSSIGKLSIARSGSGVAFDTLQ